MAYEISTNRTKDTPDMWETIDTAPKDGAEVLLYRDDAGVFIGRWTAPCHFLTDSEIERDGLSAEDAEHEGWFYADFVQGGRLDGTEQPSHWMAIPPAPQITL